MFNKALPIFTVLLVIGLRSTIIGAQAQEATDSAQITETATTSATIETQIPEPSPELLPIILDTPVSQLKKQTYFRKLPKSVYSSRDKISLVVSNGKADDTQIKIFNPDGVEVTAILEVIHQANPAVITLTMPPQFKSGRYRIITTAQDGTENIQDFLWGVLAINPDQSAYTPNQVANFSIAVLDETGLMVCDALLRLEIKAPDGQADVLTTENGKIIASPDCSIKDYTEKPDYFATYILGTAGNYKLTLSATTQNGSFTISDSVEVVDNPDYIIKRTSNTRIFPPVAYPMLLDITFNATFSGQIIETVPANFAISPNQSARSYDSIEMATESAQLRILDLPELRLPFDGVFPISQHFGSQPDDTALASKYEAYGVVGHDGTDFATPMGTAIVAIDDGIVVVADPNGTYGLTVVIEHSWGKSYYGHLSEITAQVGQKRHKGMPIALSGNSGLSTGPHLHLSIKPNNSDPDNGYYGKINPLPYLGTLITENGYQYTTGFPSDSQSVTKLVWNITAAPGDQIQLGYTYRVPNISPQFYLLGPLQLMTNDQRLMTEPRSWQLAIDADGSGTNTVNTNISEVSTTGNIYNFTYTASETMNSGGITITVPSGWSAPQGSSGTAGYTTATTTGNATIGTILTEVDSATGWAEYGGTDACATGPSLDNTIYQESTGSVSCINTGPQPDQYDGIGFSFTSQNWSAYTDLGLWLRSNDGMVSGDLLLRYEAGTNTCSGASGFIASHSMPDLAADTWTYVKITLTGTRTDVETLCLVAGGNNTIDSDTFWVDEILIGPGTPIFSGTGPWTITTRFLDMANTESAVIQYGNSAANSGVTNSSTDGIHTFTTQSKTTTAGTYTSLGNSPWITLVGSNTNLMRHGKWFNSSNAIQPFAF